MLTERERKSLSEIEECFGREDDEFAHSFTVLEERHGGDSESSRVGHRQSVSGSRGQRTQSDELPRAVAWLLSVALLSPLFALPVAIVGQDAGIGLVTLFGGPLIAILVLGATAGLCRLRRYRAETGIGRQ